jgi:RimJ/RimL family protein N-acetyltransferase
MSPFARAAVIPTARLELRPLRVEHAAEMAGVLSDPGLHTFTGGAPLDATALRARYERLVAGSPDPEVTWCNWVIHAVAERRLAGTVQATLSGPATDRTAEVAWVVGTPWQRRGYATEAARALVEWLTARSVTGVVAHMHPRHRASAAVARAAGLAPSGEWQDGEVRWRAVVAEGSARRGAGAGAGAQPTWMWGRRLRSGSASRSTSRVTGATSPRPKRKKRRNWARGLPSVHSK